MRCVKEKQNVPSIRAKKKGPEKGVAINEFFGTLDFCVLDEVE